MSERDDNSRDDRDDLFDGGNEPTAEERARAKAFARLTDDLLAGRPMPPALEAEERALLETSVSLRAAMGATTLERPRRDAVVAAAMAAATAAGTAKPARAATAPPVAVGGGAQTARLPKRGRRGALLRAAPWAISAVCAAAALALWLRGGPTARPMPGAVRSTDSLIGPIPRAQAGDAGSRLELIYQDRVAHYRGGGR